MAQKNKRDKLRIRQAVENSMGYWPGQAAIDNATHDHRDKTTEAIATEHGILVGMLNASGGRGVEIADQIDSLHIASIVRRVKRARQ